MPLAPTNSTPLSHFGIAPDFHKFWFVFTLIPMQFHGRQLAARIVLVGGVHRRRRDFRMGRRSCRLRLRPWGLELERPERQVVPVAAQVAHRAVAEIPPAIPLGPWEVNLVERPFRSGPEPQVPVQALGKRRCARRSLVHIDDVVVCAGRFTRLASPRSSRPRHAPRAPARWRRSGSARRRADSCRSA